MRVGFVIPVLNNFKGAAELIGSIKTAYEPLIYIEEQWRNKKPLAAAWNDGFERAVADGCEYIFILNDDILFAPYSVDKAISEYERLETDKVVLISCSNILSELDDPYSILKLEADDKPVDVAEHPNYSCFMVKRDFFDKVGRFDENFVPAWCEDQDSHQRIILLGYKAIITTASPCIHFGRVSTKLVGNDDSSQSVSYFTKKWGSHNPNPPQAYPTPYNNPDLTPKDWIANYGQ